MKKQLFYFGCIGQAGHYWFPRKPIDLPGVNMKILGCIDGTFTPEKYTGQGAAQETVIGPLRIVAWHDYTVDKRPKSNSNLVGYGYDNAEDMLADATNFFPTVMNRQPKPQLIP